jgi:hypothetical protein
MSVSDTARKRGKLNNLCKFLIALMLGSCITAHAQTTLRLEIFGLQSTAPDQPDPSLNFDDPQGRPTVPANAKRIWAKNYPVSMTPLSIEEVFKGFADDYVGIGFEVTGLESGTCFIRNYKFAASPHETTLLLKSAQGATGAAVNIYKNAPIVFAASVEADRRVTRYYFNLSSKIGP